MEVNVEGHDLVGTYSCAFGQDETNETTEAAVAIGLINFSQPAIVNRHRITSFVSQYSDFTSSVSAFAIHTMGQAQAQFLRAGYAGVAALPEDPVAYGFESSRLRCHLSSSAAEVGYLADPFPSPSLLATGCFVPASPTSGRDILLKVTLVDERIHMIPPGIGQYSHPSPERNSLLSYSMDPHMASGILFVYVTRLGDMFPTNEFETVFTSLGNIQTPRAFYENGRNG